MPADRLIETARHASIELLTGCHHGVNHGPEAGCKILRRLTTVTALPRAVEVDGLGDLRLRVRFSDGLVRELDFDGVFTDGVLEPLNDPVMFARARVDDAAGTVRWPDGVDLDPDVLHGDHEPADGPAPTVLAEYHLRDAG